MNSNKQSFHSGHGTVGRGNGQIQPSVSMQNHPIQSEQTIISENCLLNINTYCPNPFIVYNNDQSNTWKTNFLLLQDPRLRTLAGIAPIDRGATNSSKFVSSLHQKPCFGPHNLQYYSNGQIVPIAGYPHA